MFRSEPQIINQMNVCDDKITKLKERIDSELPTYSKAQIKRSREVTFDSSLKKQIVLQTNFEEVPFRHLFPTQRGPDALRRVFQDQTHQAILKSREMTSKKKPLLSTLLDQGPLDNIHKTQINHSDSSDIAAIKLPFPSNNMYTGIKTSQDGHVEGQVEQQRHTVYVKPEKVEAESDRQAVTPRQLDEQVRRRYPF